MDECLAHRITSLQSKGQYELNYSFSKQCSIQSVYQPPQQLTSREFAYMPGNDRYFIEGQEASYFHTPVKHQKTGPLSTHDGEQTLEPINVLQDFSMYELPTPNLKGVRWRYWDAIAKTLEELEPEIKAGLTNLDLDTEDEGHKLVVTIKDGADGMGDVAVHREKGDRYLPDKAFRFAFAIICVDVEVDGQMKNVYTNEAPNSVKCNRPLLEAIADENNHGSCTVMIQPIQEEREFLKDKVLKIDCNGQWRHYSTKFFTSMVDEKFSRAESGLKGSGSKFICTLCKATRETCKTKLGEFTIDRSYKEALEKSHLIEINPDKLSVNELEKLAEGVKSKPLLLSEPSEQGIDATHADINLGIFFRKLIIREIAGVKEWEVKQDVKYLINDAESKFDAHLKRSIGINPQMMMPGNHARQSRSSKIKFLKLIVMVNGGIILQNFSPVWSMKNLAELNLA